MKKSRMCSLQAIHIIALNFMYLSAIFLVLAFMCDCSFYLLSFIFAILTPIVFSDPRKELRGTEYCIMCSIVNIFITLATVLYSIQATIICWIVMAVVVIVALILNTIFKRLFLHRKTKGILIKNTGIQFRLFYIIMFLVHAPLSVILGFGWGACMGMLFVIVLLLAYCIYYWGWHLQFSNDECHICNFGWDRAYRSSDVSKVKAIPLIGFVALNSQKKVLFRFTLSMQNSAQLICHLRRLGKL